VKRGAEARQYEQQQAASQYQAQFQREANQADATYEQWVVNQGISKEEHAEIKAEALSELRRIGLTDQQIAYQWNSNPAMRGAYGQIQMFQASQHRINQRKLASAKRKISNPVPHVQRPGSPVERISDSHHYLRKLEKPGQPLTAKEAAAFVTARRNARR
jgi:hypothetical protein